MKIQGMQFMEAEGEPVEVFTAGNYFQKNGKHYIKYDEATEGFQETTQNLIKISGDTMEVTKRGLTNVHMVFQEKKKNLSYYNTPFGNLMVGIEASNIEVKEEPDELEVRVDYTLDINYERLADCTIQMNIQSKGVKEARLLG